MESEIQEQLGALGLELEERAPGGESGAAWLASTDRGERVLLKWFPGEKLADRYQALLPALKMLRSRGLPVPEYPFVHELSQGTLSGQRLLPGQSFAVWPARLIERVLECIQLGSGIQVPGGNWSELLLEPLTNGKNSLGRHSPRSRRILERIEAIGRAAEPGSLPCNGLVHFDLHTDNVLALEDGTLTGIVDWEDARAGDPGYDLVAIAFDLDGHGQPIWEHIEKLVEPHLQLVYRAHMTLRRTDWAIRHRPADVSRQLERAERVLSIQQTFRPTV